MRDYFTFNFSLFLQNRYNLLNRIWHPECFCCVECGKRLTPDNFIERLGAPYCKEDYHRLFSPKCCVCHLPITDVSDLRG